MSAAAAALPTPRRTEPVGLVVAGIKGLRQLIPALAGIAVLVQQTGAWGLAALPLALPVIGASFFFAWLRWRRTTYIVGAEDIRVESGVLSRAARSVPYERIQDVSLEQGPLARLFGLAEVRFETGAGGKDELKLAYLKLGEGERLRETVRARKVGPLSDAPLDATGEAVATSEVSDKVLFAMGPRRLVAMGLFQFSLAVVAVVAGAAQQFDFLLPFDLWDFDAWQRELAGPGHWLADLGIAAQVIGVLIAGVALLAIGFATGIGRTVVKEWGFTLEETDKGFRRRRGLLTRTDVVMPAHRVQALKFGTRIIRRRFGWHGLRFVSLAQDAGAASHEVAPFAKWHELEPIALAAGFAPPAENLDWHRASPKYRADTALATGALVGLGAIGTFVSLAATGAASPLFAAVPLAVAAILGGWQYFLWKFERHAIDDRQVYARHGWLAPKTDVASRVKLQSVEISHGPIARLRGYATLHLGLAGGTLAMHGIPLAEARRLRGLILDSMCARDFSTLN